MQYHPCDNFLIRTPLLPVDRYPSHLDDSDDTRIGDDQDNVDEQFRLIVDDPLIAAALISGSPSLFEATERRVARSNKDRTVQSRLLRYLIRMCSRPTPLGLLAQVSLGNWSDRTDVTLSGKISPYVRIDMAWLLTLVRRLERSSDVLRKLSLRTNPSVFFHAGRVELPEKLSDQDGSPGPRVSIRASKLVNWVIANTSIPTPHNVLVSRLVQFSPGVTRRMAITLIASLCQLDILLTDLVPPLSEPDPARYMLARLKKLGYSNPVIIKVKDVVKRANGLSDCAEGFTSAYRKLASDANEIEDISPASPLQVDSVARLSSNYVSKQIAEEAARAATLLLRLSPYPEGPQYLATYRRLFESRYGSHRMVPLMEVLDPNRGIGPPPFNETGVQSGPQVERKRIRDQLLVGLAGTALRERRNVVELDEGLIARLESDPALGRLPISVDLNVFVAAPSAASIDRGSFELVIGPNVGARAAGRTLGRFAHLLGSQANHTLKYLADIERDAHPDMVHAELLYIPWRLRATNLVMHPSIRRYQIPIGATPSVRSTNVIALKDLLLGVKHNRFFLHWSTADTEVKVSVGHMLNGLRAPIVGRFLADVGEDGIRQLNAFDWGVASGLPYLPRVKWGRILLRPAQWRICRQTAEPLMHSRDLASFAGRLREWRTEWQVPRFVYLTVIDNRLLLDLEDLRHVEILFQECGRYAGVGTLQIQEMLPTFDNCWVMGDKSPYLTELVVMLFNSDAQLLSGRRCEGVGANSIKKSQLSPRDKMGTCSPIRAKVLGSDWMYLKLYCGPDVQDDLLRGPLYEFLTEDTVRSAYSRFFFLRYADPEPHLRVRLYSTPDLVTKELIPRACSLAKDLVASEWCSKASFDTYEREIERYGGRRGITCAERLFSIDSWLALQLLLASPQEQEAVGRIRLGVLVANWLLDSLGLDLTRKVSWCRQFSQYRQAAGPLYRQEKHALRDLLISDQQTLSDLIGNQFAEPLLSFKSDLLPVGRELRKLDVNGILTRTLEELTASFIHMHCNRLFGLDRGAEERILGLLGRTLESQLYDDRVSL